MRETSGQEVVCENGRLLSVVSEHQTAEERALVVAERVGAGHERAAEDIGDAIVDRCWLPVADGFNAEPSDNASPLMPCAWGIGKRPQLGFERHLLACKSVSQLCRRTPVCPALKLAIGNGNLNSQPSAELLGVAG